MTREEEKQEKARELAIKYCKDIDPHGKEVYNIGCAIACCEMADWADQHPRKGLVDIDKIASFIKYHAQEFVYISTHSGEAKINEFKLVEAMYKAMEE